MKVIKGDNVKILSGKDRGKISEVLMVLPKKNKVVVKDVHVVSRSQKRKSDGTGSGIIKKEMPIDISNVQVIDPTSNKPARVGYVMKEGKKVRDFKVSKKEKKLAKKATKSNTQK